VNSAVLLCVEDMLDELIAFFTMLFCVVGTKVYLNKQRILSKTIEKRIVHNTLEINLPADPSSTLLF